MSLTQRASAAHALNPRGARATIRARRGEGPTVRRSARRLRRARATGRGGRTRRRTRTRRQRRKRPTSIIAAKVAASYVQGRRDDQTLRLLAAKRRSRNSRWLCVSSITLCILPNTT